MGDGDLGAVLATFDEVVDLSNPQADLAKADWVRRIELTNPTRGPIRISVDARTDGVTGLAGAMCMVFFNVLYSDGPVFWDAFVYPEPGSTPWRTLSCDVFPRGEVRAVEMHVRFKAKGWLRLRNVRVQAIEPWPDDAEVLVAIFGDSTDMTNYLPHEHRLGRRLELLLRDRFADRRVDVHCLAEGGEFVKRLVESGRLARELGALPRCDVALIRYGLNDAGQKIEPTAFGDQLHAACEMILGRFPRARLVLSTTIPGANADVYDRRTQALAEARGLPLIRLDEFLRQRSAAGDSDWHHQPGSRVGRRRTGPNPPGNEDGLGGDKHPNAYGAQMIAEHYFEHLEPIVAELLKAKK